MTYHLQVPVAIAVLLWVQPAPKLWLENGGSLMGSVPQDVSESDAFTMPG